MEGRVHVAGGGDADGTAGPEIRRRFRGRRDFSPWRAMAWVWVPQTLHQGDRPDPERAGHLPDRESRPRISEGSRYSSIYLMVDQLFQEGQLFHGHGLVDPMDGIAAWEMT
jgi:hypothetical protein